MTNPLRAYLVGVGLGAAWGICIGLLIEHIGHIL